MTLQTEKNEPKKRLGKTAKPMQNKSAAKITWIKPKALWQTPPLMLKMLIKEYYHISSAVSRIDKILTFSARFELLMPKAESVDSILLCLCRLLFEATRRTWSNSEEVRSESKNPLTEVNGFLVEMAVIETASESPFRGLSTSVAFLLNLLFPSAEKQAQRKSSPLFRDGVQGYRPFTFTARWRLYPSRGTLGKDGLR